MDNNRHIHYSSIHHLEVAKLQTYAPTISLSKNPLLYNKNALADTRATTTTCNIPHLQDPGLRLLRVADDVFSTATRFSAALDIAFTAVVDAAIVGT